MIGGNHIMESLERILQNPSIITLLLVVFILIFIYFIFKLLTTNKLKCPSCNEGELFIVRSEREEEQLTYKCNNPNCPTNH